MKTYAEQMQAIVTSYIEAGQAWPASAHEIASWAIRKKEWQPQPSSVVDMCADQLARAMREEYITDAQGRRVRSKHAARVRRNDRQTTLWADIRSADRTHMQIAFQQRRQQIVGDCAQLKRDVDSYNENRVADNPIQMVFDFTRDLTEIEALAARDRCGAPIRSGQDPRSHGSQGIESCIPAR
jgi:hypothetical protein